MNDSLVTKSYIVSGQPHILLGAQRSPSWASLQESYGKIRSEITALAERGEADLILYCSTQWLSVIGYMFQGDPAPKWTHVDHNFHDLGSMPYEFRVDRAFADAYAEEVGGLGYTTKVVDYRGFPIDTGTIVAQKLINPDNCLPAAMVSCGMYAEKEETTQIGQAAAHALAKSGKRAVAVLVSNLSNRFEVREIDPNADKVSSLKDHEWNQKILEILGRGAIEDVAQVAREFGRQANADMGFKGIWWLNGLCGQTNAFKGEAYDYQPVWGTGAALVGLEPEAPVAAKPYAQASEEGSQAEFVKAIADGAASADGSASADGAASVDGADATGEVERTDGTPSPVSTAPSAASNAGKEGPGQRPKSVVSDPKVKKKIVSATSPEPVGAYPHARQFGNLLFLSGMGPRVRGSKEIPGVTLNTKGKVTDHDIRVQTRSVIDNLKTVLENSGSSLEKLIDVQVFLTDIKRDFGGFNEVYGELIGPYGPTRTTVEVDRLPTPIAVEFKVIAEAP